MRGTSASTSTSGCRWFFRAAILVTVLAAVRIVPVPAAAFTIAPVSTKDVPGGLLEDPVAPDDAPAQGVVLTEADVPQLTAVIDAIWNGRALPVRLPERLLQPGLPVYFGFRSDGSRVAHFWLHEGNGLETLTRGLMAMRNHTWPEGERITLELVFTREFRAHDSPADSRLRSNVHRGAIGIEIAHGGVRERYSPTYVIASNRDADRLIELFMKRHKLPSGARDALQVRSFEGEQLLVELGRQPRITLMHRGNEIVPIEAVNRESLEESARLASAWLLNNVHADGRMTYKYWPSAVAESQANNMIRQWMATVALNQTAVRLGRRVVWDGVAQNIAFNLRNFYREEDGLGLIEWRRSVKLGAVALAAMAIMGHPERERWKAEEAALQRTILRLWQEDGSFRTFYRPAGRNDNQNFYPGEALFYWAMLYEETRDPALLDRIRRSFDYYRSWHLQPSNRNPAFVPWHTQAYTIIWRLEGDPAMQEFIFEMNDWLVDVMVDWQEEPLYPDTQGRFHSASRPYGPPHVSSTGVYLEGLIDAFWLARKVNDPGRADRYRVAIVRGLRSILQLQFVDEVDMFYVRPDQRRYVQGAYRTTVYNNEIRCDNVQHVLMALYKILERFESEDFIIR